MLSRLKLAVLFAAAILPIASLTFAAEVVVKSKTGPQGEMFFDPEIVRIAPGDTIHFTVEHTGHGHDAASIRGMIPDGAEPFASEPEGDLMVTLTVPGVYGFKCGPHYSAYGMVGLIVVGEPVNLEAVKQVKQLGKAKQKFEQLFSDL